MLLEHARTGRESRNKTWTDSLEESDGKSWWNLRQYLSHQKEHILYYLALTTNSLPWSLLTPLIEIGKEVQDKLIAKIDQKLSIIGTKPIAVGNMSAPKA